MCVAQIKEWLETQREAVKPVEPAKPVEKPAEKPVEKPAFDYAAYDRPPYEILTQVFPGGLPAGWNWQEWARVTGRPDPEAKPDLGPGEDRSGFVLRKDQGPRVNLLAPNQIHTYEFEADGKVEIAWGAKGHGGFIETWINQAGEQPLPSTYQRQLFTSAGQTYFTGYGKYRFFIRHDHANPVTVDVRIV